MKRKIYSNQYGFAICCDYLGAGEMGTVTDALGSPVAGAGVHPSQHSERPCYH